MIGNRKFVVRVAVLLATMVFSATTVSAQDSLQTKQFGYLSYEAALKSMPEYEEVQQKMATLREQYQAETKRVEDEFNMKYEEFLEGQREFPRTILQKRQTELQELMNRNIAFKQQSLQELADMERQALAPLKIRLIELLGIIGRERGYAFIYDTDTKALPFINTEQGEDLNEVVSQLLIDN